MWHKYKYPFLLLCLALLCYWPLTLFQNSLLCDDIDVALPTKYFAGECYQHGILPLWNPYQIWGSPAHADLQYTNWNVETLLVGILKGYDYDTLHVLFLGYLFLAGLGMYLLAKFLSKDERTGFFIGCIYMLSGVVTGHVQSLVTILGMVWMPYVLLYFLKLLREPGLRHAALLSVFSYLLMTLGYQAFAFMLLPLLAALFISKVIGYYQEKNFIKIKQLLLWSGASLLLVGLLLSPAIITQIQSKPFVSRLNGMPLAEVMSNPFAPRALISLLNPLLTIGSDALFRADITMRNLYIGLVPLLLLLLSFFKKKKTAFDIILLTVAVVYLLGSFGDALPMRELMYYTFPFFKLFRFPALLRIIVFICVLCYLSVNFRETIVRFFTKKHTRLSLLLLFIAATVATGAYAFSKAGTFSFFKTGHMPFHDKVIGCSPYEAAFYFSMLQLLILLTVLIVSSRLRLIHRVWTLLLYALIADAFLSISIYGQHTAFSSPGPQAYRDNFEKLRKGFPEPSQDPVADNGDKYNYIHNVWRNTGCYKKQLSLGDEWTSYYFTNFDFITNHLPFLKETLNGYPFIYFSKPKPTEYPVALPVDTTAAFITASFHAQDAKAGLQYKSYDPNHIVLVCNTADAVVLNLQQSYFTGWEIRLDGKPVQPLWNAGLLMSVAIPQGEHRVEFTFQNTSFTYLLIASYALLVLLLLIIIFLSPGKSGKGKITWLLALALCCFIVIRVYNAASHKRTHKTANRFAFKGAKTMSQDFDNKAGFKALVQYLHHTRPQLDYYQWSDYYNSPELLYILNLPQNDTTTALAGLWNFPPEQAMWNDVVKQGYELLKKESFEEKPDAFTDTASYNGSHSLVLNKSNPYSAAYETNSQRAAKDIFGSLWLKCGHRGTPLVVCTLKHADGSEDALYFHLNKYVLPENSWQQVPFYFDTAPLLRPGDALRLFVMNDTDATMYVDDVVYATKK